MTAIPLQERERWIGSSESAILLGVSPFATLFELWCQKAGKIARKALDGQERIEAGRFMEPAIAKWAMHKWNWPLRPVEHYLTHPTVAQMGASLDWETDEGALADGAPVEIKNVDSLVFRDHWVAEGDEILDAPVHYLVQVQHQLACLPERPHGWLVACVGGNRLYRMMVPRHGGTIARIEAEVAAFWQSIREGRAPKPDYAVDGHTLSLLHSISNGKVVDLTGNNRLPELCRTYANAKAAIKAHEAKADAAKAEIIDLIGDAEKALIADGYTVSAKTVAAADISYTRAAYRGFRLTRKKA